MHSVKGMHDLFEEQLLLWRRVESLASTVFRRYGYQEIRTPILEETQLFVRGVGEGTDIVDKEMYVFADRDGKSLCLRPEGTAGVVRALVQRGGLSAQQETKVYYTGPMFRRERPQKGRSRQFFQLGAEVLGCQQPSIDVEMIGMVHQFLCALGIPSVQIIVNSLGNGEDRRRYSEILIEHYAQHADKLCPDCKTRLVRNPHRLLDCKVADCQGLATQAPKTTDHLCDASKTHFDAVLQGLADLEVPVDVAPRLVRGLDYYTHTVFEALAPTGLGAQNAVAAGGRYDGLVAELGGPAVSGVGFGAGIDRLVLVMEDQGIAAPENRPEVFLVAADHSGARTVSKLAMALRQRGLWGEVDHMGRSVKAQMRRADKLGVLATAVIWDTEVGAGRCQLKKLATGAVQDCGLTTEQLALTLRALASPEVGCIV